MESAITQLQAQCRSTERYAARFAVAVFWLVFAIPRGYAAELLESVQLVNGGAVLSCDYTDSDGGFTFTCQDAHTVFGLRCVSVAWSDLKVQRPGQREFLCPVSAESSAFGNALRLRCSGYEAASQELMRTSPNPRLLVEGRIPTHHCQSAKVDIE